MTQKSKKVTNSRQKSKEKKSKKDGSKPKLKERLTEMLELPKEIVLNMPKLMMLGNGDLIIENYKGIIQYDRDVVRVNTTSGIIKLKGLDIYIKEITEESIMIYGNITSLEFLKQD